MPISMTVGRRPRPAGPTCFLPTDSQHMPCLTSAKADNQLCLAYQICPLRLYLNSLIKSGPGFPYAILYFVWKITEG